MHLRAWTWVLKTRLPLTVSQHFPLLSSHGHCLLPGLLHGLPTGLPLFTLSLSSLFLSRHSFNICFLNTFYIYDSQYWTITVIEGIELVPTKLAYQPQGSSEKFNIYYVVFMFIIVQGVPFLLRTQLKYFSMPDKAFPICPCPLVSPVFSSWPCSLCFCPIGWIPAPWTPQELPQIWISNVSFHCLECASPWFLYVKIFLIPLVSD